MGQLGRRVLGDCQIVRLQAQALNTLRFTRRQIHQSVFPPFLRQRSLMLGFRQTVG